MNKMETKNKRHYLREANHINLNIQVKDDIDSIKENSDCDVVEEEELNSSVYENSSEDNNFNLRLAQWFCRNNISIGASNDLLMLLSEKISNLPKDVQTLISTPKDKIRHSLKITEKKQDLIIANVERLTAEMIGVKNDISVIKASMQRDPNSKTTITPSNPFATAEQFIGFEEVLQDESCLKTFISELQSANEKSFEKFIRMSWRKIFSDELAQRYSWRGTQNKKCIRHSIVTLAIRSAFKQKYPLDDEDFDKLTQKYFQHAHDRMVKVAKKIKTVN